MRTICPRHPVRWEVVRRRAAKPTTREFHPSVVLTKQPNAVTRSRLGVSHSPTVIADTGWRPGTCSRMDRRPPDWRGLGAPDCAGLRFHASEREFLTNGYSLFKVQIRKELFKPFTNPDLGGEMCSFI